MKSKTTSVKQILGKQTPITVRVTLLFIFSALILVAMYSKYSDGIYAQDDPNTIRDLTNDNLSIIERINSANWNRYRPVANLFELPIVNAVQNSYSIWIIVAIFISAALSTYLSYVFYQVNRSFYLGLALVLLVTTSRFNTGILLNLTFLLETISIFLLLPLLQKFLLNWEKSSFEGFKISIFLYTALILSHERYVGLNLFFVIYFLLHKQYSLKKRVLYTFVFSMPTVILFLVKYYILQIPIFVGTGSVNEVGFSIKTAFTFLAMLIMGIFGINYGYEYLHGYIFQNQPTQYQVISLLISFITLLLLVSASINRIGKNSSNVRDFLRGFLLYLSLFASLAVPVIATIRIEHRWFLPVYIIFVFLLLAEESHKQSWIDRSILGVKIKSFLIALFVASNLVMNFFYTQRIDSLYFINTQKAMKVQLTSIENIVLGNPNLSRTVYVIDPTNQISLEELNLAIDANLININIDIVRISGISEVDNVSSPLLIEQDPNMTVGNYRVVSRK